MRTIPQRTRPRRWIILLLTTAGVISVLLFALPWLLRPSAMEVQRRAEPIIGALQDYYEVHGSYPAQLTDLLPQQLNEIPGTGLRHSFHYIPCLDGQTYTLEFTRQPNPMSFQYYGYTNTLPRWLCSDAAPVFHLNSPCGGTQPHTPFFPCA